MATLKAVYDVIIIGAGIEGSACAYTLAKQAKKVLLLEQFPLPHGRGSSHGQSRITRYAYTDEFYVRMMVDAFPLWTQLEKEAQTDLFVNCGVLDLRTDNSKGLNKVLDSLRAHNIPHEKLTSKEIQHRFPTMITDDKDAAIWDPNGGLLKADKALKAYQEIFKKNGGTIHDNELVTSVTPGNVVVVSTNRSVYSAHSVVLAAGPWSGRLCSSLGLELPLSPVRISVFYWKASEEYINKYGAQSFPCFIDSRWGEDVFHSYGLPISEYPGLVKVCFSEGTKIDPDYRDKGVDDTWIEEGALRTVTSTFKGLDTKPSIREYCIYTLTPDFHPFIDRHPRHPNVIIAAGFSGHGFKLAPAVGKAVTELVLAKSPTYNMQPFRIERFQPKAQL